VAAPLPRPPTAPAVRGYRKSNPDSVGADGGRAFSSPTAPAVRGYSFSKNALPRLPRQGVIMFQYFL